MIQFLYVRVHLRVVVCLACVSMCKCACALVCQSDGPPRLTTGGRYGPFPTKNNKVNVEFTSLLYECLAFFVSFFGSLRIGTRLNNLSSSSHMKQTQPPFRDMIRSCLIVQGAGQVFYEARAWTSVFFSFHAVRTICKEQPSHFGREDTRNKQKTRTQTHRHTNIHTHRERENAYQKLQRCHFLFRVHIPRSLSLYLLRRLAGYVLHTNLRCLAPLVWEDDVGLECLHRDPAEFLCVGLKCRALLRYFT